MTQNQKNCLIKFKQFVTYKNKFSLILSLIILICYYAFCLAVGLVPQVLGLGLGDSSISIGIILGITLIVLSVFLTGVYTFVANKTFDKEQEKILQSLRENDLLEQLSQGKINYKDNE